MIVILATMLAFLLTICLALGITFGNLGMNKYYLELYFGGVDWVGAYSAEANAIIASPH